MIVNCQSNLTSNEEYSTRVPELTDGIENSRKQKELRKDREEQSYMLFYLSICEGYSTKKSTNALENLGSAWSITFDLRS